MRRIRCSTHDFARQALEWVQAATDRQKDPPSFPHCSRNRGNRDWRLEDGLLSQTSAEPSASSPKAAQMALQARRSRDIRARARDFLPWVESNLTERRWEAPRARAGAVLDGSKPAS